MKKSGFFLLVALAVLGFTLVGCDTGGGTPTTYYDVTFKANYTDGPADVVKKVASGDTVGVANIPAWVRADHTLTDWKSGAAAPGNTTFTATTPITGDLNVWAQWAPSYSSSTKYLGKLIPAAETYAVVDVDGKTGVLMAANGASNAVEFYIDVPSADFDGKSTLDIWVSMSGSLRVDTASKFLWQNPQDGYSAFTDVGYNVHAADTWILFTVTDKKITVTNGTPYRIQASDGGENGNFNFYIADFEISAKTGSIDYAVIEDFEGSAPTLTDIGGGAGTVVSLSSISELSGETGGDSKALQIVISGYNQGVTFPITLPTGKTLADYSNLVFDGAVIAGGDGTYKKVKAAVSEEAVIQYGDGVPGHGLWGDYGSQTETTEFLSTGSLQTAYAVGDFSLAEFTQTLSETVYIGLGIGSSGCTFIVDNIRLPTPSFTDYTLIFGDRPVE
ncbi:hypothetical protein AGMMS49928_23530 [Spirochaetia bacterium]|nr:hypothetical protein AGMMS49928_23530 [Spirochaetia bacterium]